MYVISFLDCFSFYQLTHTLYMLNSDLENSKYLFLDGLGSKSNATYNHIKTSIV